MAKEVIEFAAVLADVPPDVLDFVQATHAELLEAGTSVKIERAKSGYVVSYNYPKSVLANYVFRRTGMFIRLYADCLYSYEGLLEELPEPIVQKLQKAPVCRRLVDPTKCNARCKMGYDYTLRGERQQKCRFSAFLLKLEPEHNEAIKGLLDAELAARKKAVEE